MSQTNQDRVLEYIRSVAPHGATNSQIREATGISPHQQVFQLTQRLVSHGLIGSTRDGREWTFYTIDSPALRTNRDRVLEHLQTIAPQGATNSQIRVATGISPHPQVYQLTQDLMRRGRIQGIQNGHVWIFNAGDEPANSRSTLLRVTQEETLPATGQLSPSEFERLARRVMSDHSGVPLKPGEVSGVPKLFDMVSADGQIVGDAKYYTLVGGTRLPPAKFATIAEHVWLLEKTFARIRFLVFGNEPKVPQYWLTRYGRLASGVDFYFITDNGELKQLERR